MKAATLVAVLLLPMTLALPVAFAAEPQNKPPAATAGAKAGATTAGKPAGRVDLPVTTFKLDNGLTVLVHEDHSVPLVAVNLWYHVGSREEKPGRTGFAHLFEHLMFQGSEHVGDDQHLRLISEAGGSANATTAEDRTNFFEEVPSNFVERALFLEADRMGWFLPALTQEKLDNQRDVVRNERRQSFENRPYGMVDFAVHENIYPVGHPYHFTTIGTHEDLEHATLDDVKDFFRTYYGPENAALSIAGDVTVARARQLVQKYFGAIPKTDVPAHAAAAPVTLAADKRVRLEDNVSLERLYLVWPTPAAFKPGDAELDLLATTLGGKSGRLFKRLVYRDRVAQSVEVVQASADLGSMFYVVVTAKPGHTAAEMEKIVGEETGKLGGEAPITKEELARVQNQWEASFVYGLQDFGGLADRLNQYFYSLGSAASFDRDRQRYIDATVDGVQGAARQLFASHHLTLTVVPAKAAPPPQAAPPPPPPRPIAPSAPVAPATPTAGKAGH